MIVFVVSILIPYIKQKIGAENFAELQKWVKVAVQAAEMIYKEAGMGNMKKKYVECFIDDLGIKVDAQRLDNLIESAVLELKKGLE